MWFLYSLTWISFFVQMSFAVISVVTGLYYLAELVEEYTVLSKKIITWMIICVLICFIGLLLFEDFPKFMLICGIVSQLTHLLIMKTFPYVSLTSPTFIIALILLILNHYLAFRYFSNLYHSFSEIMAYFTICLWMIPFLLLISLSANDYVLPTTNQTQLMDDLDVVGKYFLKKGKKYGLLTFFNHCKDSILPERTKKRF